MPASSGQGPPHGPCLHTWHVGGVDSSRLSRPEWEPDCVPGMGRQCWACDHLNPGWGPTGIGLDSVPPGTSAKTAQAVLESLVSALKEGLLWPPCRPHSPLSCPPPTAAGRTPQTTSMDHLGIPESTVGFGVRSSTTLPLLGIPLLLVPSVWPGMWKGGAAPLPEEESVLAQVVSWEARGG